MGIAQLTNWRDVVACAKHRANQLFNYLNNIPIQVPPQDRPAVQAVFDSSQLPVYFNTVKEHFNSQDNANRHQVTVVNPNGRNEVVRVTCDMLAVNQALPGATQLEAAM